MGCIHSTPRADSIRIPYDGECTRSNNLISLAAACTSVRLSRHAGGVAFDRLPCDDALLRAAKDGDEARLESALLAGANPNCRMLPVRGGRGNLRATFEGDPRLTPLSR